MQRKRKAKQGKTKQGSGEGKESSSSSSSPKHPWRGRFASMFRRMQRSRNSQKERCKTSGKDVCFQPNRQKERCKTSCERRHSRARHLAQCAPGPAAPGACRLHRGGRGAWVPPLRRSSRWVADKRSVAKPPVSTSVSSPEGVLFGSQGVEVFWHRRIPNMSFYPASPAAVARRSTRCARSAGTSAKTSRSSSPCSPNHKVGKTTGQSSRANTSTGLSDKIRAIIEGGPPDGLVQTFNTLFQDKAEQTLAAALEARGRLGW